VYGLRGVLFANAFLLQVEFFEKPFVYGLRGVLLSISAVVGAVVVVSSFLTFRVVVSVGLYRI
jgi:hypothetical protein